MLTWSVYTNPLCPFAHRVWMTILALDIQNDCTLIPIPLSLEITLANNHGGVLPSGVGIGSLAELKSLKQWYTQNLNTTVPFLMESDGSYVFFEEEEEAYNK